MTDCVNDVGLGCSTGSCLGDAGDPCAVDPCSGGTLVEIAGSTSIKDPRLVSLPKVSKGELLMTSPCKGEYFMKMLNKPGLLWADAECATISQAPKNALSEWSEYLYLGDGSVAIGSDSQPQRKANIFPFIVGEVANGCMQKLRGPNGSGVLALLWDGGSDRHYYGNPFSAKICQLESNIVCDNAPVRLIGFPEANSCDPSNTEVCAQVYKSQKLSFMQVQTDGVTQEFQNGDWTVESLADIGAWTFFVIDQTGRIRRSEELTLTDIFECTGTGVSVTNKSFTLMGCVDGEVKEINPQTAIGRYDDQNVNAVAFEVWRKATVPTFVTGSGEDDGAATGYVQIEMADDASGTNTNIIAKDSLESTGFSSVSAMIQSDKYYRLTGANYQNEFAWWFQLEPDNF